MKQLDIKTLKNTMEEPSIIAIFSIFTLDNLANPESFWNRIHYLSQLDVHYSVVTGLTQNEKYIKTHR